MVEWVVGRVDRVMIGRCAVAEAIAVEAAAMIVHVRVDRTGNLARQSQ